MPEDKDIVSCNFGEDEWAIGCPTRYATLDSEVIGGGVKEAALLPSGAGCACSSTVIAVIDATCTQSFLSTAATGKTRSGPNIPKDKNESRRLTGEKDGR